MTVSGYRRYSAWRGISDGSIGGFVGSLAMIPFFLLPGIMAGMPATIVFTAIGVAFGYTGDSATAVGVVMHLATGSMIGIIFGALVGGIKKLRITSVGKGVGEGLIAGMVAFVVLAIPLNTFVMSPVMVQLMTEINSDISSGQAMGMLQQGMTLTIVIGVIEHLVYGAVLGAVTASLALKFKSMAVPVGEISSNENKYVCSACQKKFSNIKEMDEHLRGVHHSAAA